VVMELEDAEDVGTECAGSVYNVVAEARQYGRGGLTRHWTTSLKKPPFLEITVNIVDSACAPSARTRSRPSSGRRRFLRSTATGPTTTSSHTMALRRTPYTQAPTSEYNNRGDPSVRGRHPGPFPATEHSLGSVRRRRWLWDGHRQPGDRHIPWSQLRQCQLFLCVSYQGNDPPCARRVRFFFPPLRSYAYKVAGQTI
jgi:hypothetical protein